MYEICCIKGCENKSVALGLCANHWRQNRAYGSPVATKAHTGRFRGKSAEERFNLQVKKGDGCWIWMGSKDKNGYGIFKGEVGGELFARAHRFSYAFHTGDLLIGMHAMHSCDNPSCVNPAHLSSGTSADNMRDKAQKGRARVPLGEKNPRSILTDAQAAAILIDPRPYSAIATEYNVAVPTINSLKQRHSWRHIEGDVVKQSRRGTRSGEKSHIAKLTDANVLAIRASTDTGKNLAATYGVSPQTITDIRKFRSWTHLQNPVDYVN